MYTSVNRLQHEVDVLQQQLSECQCLVHTLQCELQVYQRVCGTTESNTGKKQVHLSETQSDRILLILPLYKQSIKMSCALSAVGSGLSLTFDLRERESNIHLLEQQLRERLDQCMPRPSARKRLFHGDTTNYNNQS